MNPLSIDFGIRANLGQIVQQLLQALLVGMTIGMMRNVVPAHAETEFGVPRGSFMLLVAFVVAFGFVKGAMNFVAGHSGRTFFSLTFPRGQRSEYLYPVNCPAQAALGRAVTETKNGRLEALSE